VVSEFDARTGAWRRFHGLDPAYCEGVGRGGRGGGGGVGGDAARCQQALQLQGSAGIAVSSSVRTVFFIFYLFIYLFLFGAGIAVSCFATCFLNSKVHPAPETRNPNRNLKPEIACGVRLTLSSLLTNKLTNELNPNRNPKTRNSMCSLSHLF
jgi:hypothetical protein